MKTSIERTSCNNCSFRISDSYKRNVISLGKMVISKFFTLLANFSRETIKVLSEVQFFEITFFVPHQCSKFIQYLTPTSSFSWACDSFSSRLTKSLVFQHLNFFSTCFCFNVCIVSEWVRSSASPLCSIRIDL